MATLDRILIAAERGAAMHDAQCIEAIVGRGLRGDRYATGRGTFSGRAGVLAGAREVSIIDARAVARCNHRLGLSLDASAFRRNLVFDGLDFTTLAHCELAIGDVRLRVTGSCPPCGYLSRLLGIDARTGLRGIGGVRATIVHGGMLRRRARVAATVSRGGLP